MSLSLSDLLIVCRECNGNGTLRTPSGEPFICDTCWGTRQAPTLAGLAIIKLLEHDRKIDKAQRDFYSSRGVPCGRLHLD